MMRSLFSGVAGLKTHQTKMDVIGNNIANVNTVAYKSNSVTFQDLMYQTTQAASGANAQTGRAGINAKQIGLGVRNGAISTNITTSGATQNTGNPFDVQLNGDSFFIVSDGQTNFFTRAGTFNIDANGTLCMTTNGYAVMGWQADEEGNIIKNTVSQLRPMSDENVISNPEATSEGYMTGIIDSNDAQLRTDDGQISTLQFYDNKGYSYTLKLSIIDYKETGGVKEPIGTGDFYMSATDILNAEGKSIFTYENTGITPPTGKQPTDELTAVEKRAILQAYKLFAEGTSDDNAGNAPTFGEGINLHYNDINGSWVGTAATDKNTGFTINLAALAAPAGTGVTKPLIDGFTPQDTMDVDMSSSKNIDNNSVSTISGKTGTLKNKAVGAGRAAGEMDSLSIQQDGKIVASYTNGTEKILGQIAVANFSNPAGLQKAGDNLYQSTQNSGAFDGVGSDITADGGSMSSGVLEMSNVDLSTEFTEMITTQRGFQANSRIITVSDTMIEELVNLKR